MRELSFHSTINSIQKWLDKKRKKKKKIILIPTMGNLHQGHLDLINSYKKSNTETVVSIFVNPMQFNLHEDFDSYPRTLESDLQTLQTSSATSVFAPNVREMYPFGVRAQIDIPKISSILCGASRPGHFQGVATVVAKLFNIIKPDVAIFGKKDYQQLQIIRIMADDLLMPIKIVSVETTREISGLALSSRNDYLLPNEKLIAPSLYGSLLAIRTGLLNKKNIQKTLEKEREKLRDLGFKIDYLEIRNASDLTATPFNSKRIIMVAAVLGKARLIDNIIVDT